MTKLVAIPLVEVGGVRFGMSREEVRRIFGAFTEFRKNRFSQNTTDDFGYCHVFYDAENRCEAIEVFPEAEVSIGGKTVIPATMEEIKVAIPTLVEEDGSWLAVELSIGVSSADDKVNGILFGKPGYYQE